MPLQLDTEVMARLVCNWRMERRLNPNLDYDTGYVGWNLPAEPVKW